MTRKMNTILENKNVLLLNFSQRKDGNTSQLLSASTQVLKRYPSINIVEYSFCGKHPNETKDDASGSQDGFEEMIKAWLSADGILLGAPVYTFGPPSPTYAFFERLRHAFLLSGKNDKLPVPVGIIVQGGAAYSGAESTLLTMISLCLSAGCSPISGDMPGFSQGIIGQVEDGSVPTDLLICGVQRLTERLLEMMAILSTGSAQKIDEINLLTIRVGENNNKLTNTSTPVANAIINDWKTSIYHISFDFSEHAFHPCKACTDYCSKHLECVFDDGMQILRRLWLKADGVLWMANTPNDFMHPSLVSFFDRMNQVRFESYFSIGMTHMSRYAKAVGVIVSSDFNASTANTVRFIRQTALQYQNVILPLPFIERNTEQKNLRPDIEQADISMRLNITANQLSALAATLKSGLRSLKGTLPEEYYPSLLHFGRNAGKEEMVEN